MDYYDKRSDKEIFYNCARPECVVREENVQLWQDVVRLEEIRKQKLKQQRDAILRASLQVMKKF